MAREPETYCEDSIFETGIGQVVVCRYKSGGRVETGSFLRLDGARLDLLGKRVRRCIA